MLPAVNFTPKRELSQEELDAIELAVHEMFINKTKKKEVK